jgi:TPR repeat protein
MRFFFYKQARPRRALPVHYLLVWILACVAKPSICFSQSSESANSAVLCGQGLSYEKGLGVPEDISKAFSLIKQASEAGSIPCTGELGYMYEHGKGTKQNYKTALKLLRKAADDGHATSMNNIGWMYLNGLGVKPDLQIAFENFQRAANLGDRFAQNNLGNMYRDGQGVQQDTTLAISYYRKAVAQGLPEASTSLQAIEAESGVDQSTVYQPATSTLSSVGDAVRGAPQCRWPSDFNRIRDEETLSQLRAQNFGTLLQQGGISIDQQIASGEATLAQIAATLPQVEQTISGISSPTITHFNFQFDYERFCKQNPNKDALLASECQHVNIENTRYAMNGTLQIMQCLAGEQLQADIGPNRDTAMPEDSGIAGNSIPQPTFMPQLSSSSKQLASEACAKNMGQSCNIQIPRCKLSPISTPPGCYCRDPQIPRDSSQVEGRDMIGACLVAR